MGARPTPFYYPNCGIVWVPGQQEKSIAGSESFNNCRPINHFGKVCRKQNRKKNARTTRKKSVNVVEEEEENGLYESNYSSGDNMVTTMNDELEKIESFNMPIKIFISLQLF